MIYWLQIFVMLSALLSSPAQPAQQACLAASGEPVVIGAVFPEGNLLSPTTAEYFRGAQAFADAVNTCGGINGQPIEWRYVAANNRNEAVIAIHELADEGITLVVGSGTEAVSIGLAEGAEQTGILVWDATEFNTRPNEWVYNPNPSHRQIGELAAHFINTQFADSEVTLIYEQGEQGTSIANGLRRTLGSALAIDVAYRDNLAGTGRIAEQTRDRRIGVMTMVAFQTDACRVWSAMQNEDTNVQGLISFTLLWGPPNTWIQCGMVGNTEAQIIVSRTHTTLPDNALFIRYAQSYQTMFGRESSHRANYTASGLLFLFTELLPEVNGSMTVDALRDVMENSIVPDGSGWYGEGYAFDAETGRNQRAQILFQQEQAGTFCTLAPLELAECVLMPFPTWRQRALNDPENTGVPNNMGMGMMGND